MAVCLMGGAKVAVVAAELFSVGWTVETTGAEWRRTYMVAPGAIVTAEMRAKAATPDAEAPLPGSVREEDWFVWRSSRRAFPVIAFGSEPGTRDWRVCWDGSCKRLDDLTGAPAGRDITAVPCKAEPVPG